MLSYEEMLRYAYQIVDYTTKDYEKHKFNDVLVLSGTRPAIITNKPGGKHNYKVVVDAFHLYQKNNSHLRIEDRFNYATLRTIQLVKNREGMKNIFTILYYELKKEKEGSASFYLDFDRVFDELTKIEQTKKNMNSFTFNLSREILKLKRMVYEVRNNSNNLSKNVTKPNKL